MIACYEGVLGGGKSYHAVRHILNYLRSGGHVYTNITLVRSECESFCRDRYGVEIQFDNQVHFLPIESLGRLHKFVKGGTMDSPTLVVADEIHLYNNSRDWASADRGMLAWLTQSRKLHVDIIFIAQHRNNVDKQWVRLVGEYWHFRDLRKWVIPGLGMRMPWFQMLACRIDQDGKTVLTRSWERIDKRIFKCYSSDQLFDGFLDNAGRGQARVKLAKSKMSKGKKMKYLVIIICLVGGAASLLTKACHGFRAQSAPLAASVSPAPLAASPAVSPPLPPPRPSLQRDFAVSWWGSPSVEGGQGKSGLVHRRPPDGYVWDVPYWWYEPIDAEVLDAPVAGPSPSSGFSDSSSAPRSFFVHDSAPTWQTPSFSPGPH